MLTLHHTTKLVRFYRFKYFSSCTMSAPKCKIAVCQFTSTNNKSDNLETVKRLVNEAAQKDAKMVFLPEACDYIGSSSEEIQELAEPLTGPLINEYKNLAKSHKVWLSVGGFHELAPHCKEDEKKIYNAHVLIDANGEIQSVYKKVHLYDVSIPEKNIHLKESDLTNRGYEIVPPVNTPAGPMSLSICYDVRFPELGILQRNQGASILTYPSAFVYHTGLAHWEVLLRARAIETQCFVVAAAQYGRHNSTRISYGHALIIDPWGKILAECPKFVEGQDTCECIAIATIDSEEIDNVRRNMPVFQHRRDDLYQLTPIENGPFQLNDNESFMFANKCIPGSTVFYRTRHSFAFTNIRCVVPGHVLVSSIRPATRLENLSKEEVADLFQTAVKVQKVMENVNEAISSTICVQDGKDAGQTVPHVHIHILPRQPNDFERKDDIYNKLADHEREENPLRDLSEMIQEAKKLRSYFT